MTCKLWFVFLCAIATSFNIFAQEFEFIVSPENCGKMTLEECEEFMAWAEDDNSALQTSIEDDKAEINRMHEEALNTLSESRNKD